MSSEGLTDPTHGAPGVPPGPHEGGERDGGAAAHPKKRKSMVDSGKVGEYRGVWRIGGGRERWGEADPCH